MYDLTIPNQEPMVICSECLDIIPDDEAVEMAPDSFMCATCFEKFMDGRDMV